MDEHAGKDRKIDGDKGIHSSRPKHFFPRDRVDDARHNFFGLPQIFIGYVVWFPAFHFKFWSSEEIEWGEEGELDQ